MTAKRVVKHQQSREKVKMLNHEDAVNHSNMLNLSDHQRKKSMKEAYDKMNYNEIIKVDDGGMSFIDELDEHY